jgi:hypothetical protein
MPANERRIVHIALQTVPTSSKPGFGEDRKVSVSEGCGAGQGRIVNATAIWQ